MQQPEILARELMNAAQERNIEKVAALLDDHVVFEDVPENKAIYGKEAALQKFKAFFSLSSKIELELMHILSDNTTAMVERKAHVVIQEKDIFLSIVSVIECHDGKITLFRDYFDLLSFTKQLED